MGLPLQVSKPFSRQGTKTGITSMPKFVSTAFGDIVLAQGMNSDPVNLKNGSVVIMHLQKHYAAYHMPFDKVMDKVKLYLFKAKLTK